jgi:hypothetical protein
MAQVKLGKDQQISLDGVPLEGARDIELDLSLRTTEVTSWEHQWASTLQTHIDCSIKLVLYWKEDYARIKPKLTEHPVVPLQLSVANVFSFYVVPVAVKIVCPLDGVLAWEVTLKMHSYNIP